MPEGFHGARLVALCGAPGAGKTTAATVLARHYGCTLVDDGEILREAALSLFGGSREDYWTQEGKARRKTICGRDLENRVLLGELGNRLEAWFGDRVIPELTLRRLAERSSDRLGAGAVFLFPSVRKTQGAVYREHGGLVLEITRPGHVPVNDFDHYDKSVVTHSIANDGAMVTFIARLVGFAEGTLGLSPVERIAP